MFKFLEPLLTGERDKRIIEEFYSQNRNKCLSAAMRHTKSLVIAEDALHDALVVILKHKEKYAAMESRKLFNYVNCMVKNRIKDMQKKDKPIIGISITDLADCLHDNSILFFDLPSPQEEKERLLHKSLSQISESDRSLLIMKYCQNMSSDEIGDLLRVKPNAINARLNRARERVRGLFERFTDNEE